jgi:hypothetical protein
MAQGGLLGSAQANTSCAGELRTVCETTTVTLMCVGID